MSIVKLEIENKTFRIDSEKGFDLSIPIHFQEKQPSVFGAAPPTAKSFQKGPFLGDTRRGGSCNVQQYTLIPHCHGTHTECVGHLVDEPVSIQNILNDVWIPATLLSIRTETGALCSDRYTPKPENRDALISEAGVTQAIQAYPTELFHQAVIVRTLPNDRSEKTNDSTTTAYFSNDAMQKIVHYRVWHLLVDLPSIDRVEDQGRLSNHRIFWQLKDQEHALKNRAPSTKTITELIYVPDEIRDGYYFLNLQIAPFMSDAAPSRPMIFAVDPE